MPGEIGRRRVWYYLIQANNFSDTIRTAIWQLVMQSRRVWENGRTCSLIDKSWNIWSNMMTLCINLTNFQSSWPRLVLLGTLRLAWRCCRSSFQRILWHRFLRLMWEIWRWNHRRRYRSSVVLLWRDPLEVWKPWLRSKEVIRITWMPSTICFWFMRASRSACSALVSLSRRSVEVY